MIKDVASNKYTNIESLCCTLESNLMLYVDYLLVKKKDLISKSQKNVSREWDLPLENYRKENIIFIVNPSLSLVFLATCIHCDDDTFQKVLKYNHPMLGLIWYHHPYWNFFQWPLMTCLFLNRQELFKHAEICIGFYSHYLNTYLIKKNIENLISEFEDFYFNFQVYIWR